MLGKMWKGGAMILRSIRNEVLEFGKVAERILSPASLTRELTEEECTLIAGYVKDLAGDRHPWSKFIPSEMSQDSAWRSKRT
jgi:hypothetical protein